MATFTQNCTVKMVIVIPVPGESLVSGIPAGDWKNGNLFSQCVP
jgi:hypothetical protein